MISPAVNLNDVNHAIQLAIAPVFLLTGIAGILNVITGRLARIVDRGRQLVESPLSNPLASEQASLELASLERRRSLASAAITNTTLSALLVCMVIAALFLEALLGLQFKWVAGFLFMGATLALVVGLAYFLREVHLATQTVRIQSRSPTRSEDQT